jgi:hypothetical protein
MRRIILVFPAFALMLLGQASGPKNLQVLKPAEVRDGMRNATVGLGITCAECHTDDRASDDKPAKLIARKMFSLVADINSKAPDGKGHVTCYTCHRGQKQPLYGPPTAQ